MSRRHGRAAKIPEHPCLCKCGAALVTTGESTTLACPACAALYELVVDVSSPTMDTNGEFGLTLTLRLRKK